MVGAGEIRPQSVVSLALELTLSRRFTGVGYPKYAFAIMLVLMRSATPLIDPASQESPDHTRRSCREERLARATEVFVSRPSSGVGIQQPTQYILFQRYHFGFITVMPNHSSKHLASQLTDCDCLVCSSVPHQAPRPRIDGPATI